MMSSYRVFYKLSPHGTGCFTSVYLIMCWPPSCSAMGRELGPGQGSRLEVGRQQIHSPGNRVLELLFEVVTKIVELSHLIALNNPHS